MLNVILCGAAILVIGCPISAMFLAYRSSLKRENSALIIAAAMYNLLFVIVIISSMIFHIGVFKK